MSIRNLDFVFKPRSVALIGASKKASSVGAVLAHNLFNSGFDGPIMPVNPKDDAIEGVLTYRDIDALPRTPDLAVIATPPPTVSGLISALGERGTKAAAPFDRRCWTRRAPTPCESSGPTVWVSWCQAWD